MAKSRFASLAPSGRCVVGEAKRKAVGGGCTTGSMPSEEEDDAGGVRGRQPVTEDPAVPGVVEADMADCIGGKGEPAMLRLGDKVVDEP